MATTSKIDPVKLGFPPKAPEGHFNMLYFATASDFTGKDFETIPATLRIGDLFTTLEERYNGFSEILKTCLVTVNTNYVDVEKQADFIIKQGDEVALIPPVSSG